MVDQAQHLVSCARLLPADAAAKALEQVATIVAAAQADILIDAERSGELKDSGCATVRTFAQTILRRSVNDASALARIAQHLVEFPKLAQAYRAGEVSTGNLRVVVDHLRPCGLAALQANEDLLVDLATRAGPGEVKQLCQHIADLHHPDRDQAKAKALGLRSVKISRVGDLAHVDAMLDPVVADQLKATLAAMAKASRPTRNSQDVDGDPVVAPSYPERQATALEDLILRGIAAPDGRRGATRRRR